MTSSFGESVSLIGSIRSILETYPFSAGLLREILQNSDDAKAKKQVFLLDCRTHPSERIWDPRIAETQGPALLAYNDASFLPEDWIAVQNINQSSKKADTSKIGKFGIGIRSCYHITDYLQILSGESLAIFDPQRTIEGGGTRFSFASGSEHHDTRRDHLLAFRHFLPDDWDAESFDGTVVRLPLRTQPSDIRDKTVSPQEIGTLFHEFIKDELNVSMLFLQHLRSIELTIIDDLGNVHNIGSCRIESAHDEPNGFCKKMVHIHTPENSSKEEEWLITNQRPTVDEALALLSSRAGSLSGTILRKHKLRPDVGIAFPVNAEPSHKRDIGQLFTYLRLPLETGFPAHVHALFSLTPSRQNLRNPADKGVVKGSDDHILVEWNKLLFEVFIPRAWSKFLEILAQEYPTIVIFSAWPSPQSLSRCGESVYWNTFSRRVLENVLESGLAVWPVLGQATYHALEHTLVASSDADESAVRALAGAGLMICNQVPSYIFDMIQDREPWQQHVLTPDRAAKSLKDHFVPRLLGSNPTDRRAILQYLLTTKNLANIVGLPIVPTVSSRFVTLFDSEYSHSKAHTLLEAKDAELFQLCDEDAINLSDLPTGATKLFEKHASTFNVKFLDADRVIKYLALHPTRLDQSMGDSPDLEAVAFLSRFWVWVDKWSSRSLLIPQLDPLNLLPCEHGLEPANRSHPVFQPLGITEALSVHLSNVGVPFLSSTVDASAYKVLEKYGYLKPVCNISFFLDRLEGCRIGEPLTEENASALMSLFKRHMPVGSELSDTQQSTFRQLPLFPVVEYRDDGSALVLNRRRIAIEGLIAYATRSFKFLPTLPNAVFVDATDLDAKLLPVLNEAYTRPLSDMDILLLCFKRLDKQPKRLLAQMLEYLTTRRRKITPDCHEMLRSDRFVESASGTKEMPQSLIDPKLSPLYPLYVDDKQRLPRLDDELDRKIVAALSTLDLLDSKLTPANVLDRIQFIAANPFNPSSFGCSIKLLEIIYNKGFACDGLLLDKTIPWLPNQKGNLVNALQCRPGKGASVEELYLFDQILDLVHSSAPVSSALRTVLGWDDPIPVDTLIKQFDLVLGSKEPPLYARVKCLINALGKRKLSAEEWNTLRGVLKDREWVPTSHYSLVEPWQAVITSSFPGIFQVAQELGSSTKICRFLKNLGCLDAPTFDTVSRRLDQLSKQPQSADTAASATSALRYVASNLTLSDEDRARLLAPDEGNRLRDITKIVFNDVGVRAMLVKRDSTIFIASSLIDDSLARLLNLERLGLKHAYLEKTGEDMGVSPATIVGKTLAQYTELQFLPEFLANAQDAGASCLVVLLNDYEMVPDTFLTHALERIYAGPSVMVYNDKEFSDDDFAGICKTHIGSKASHPDSIGQFGLGALTMFHVTECAVIYSGESVLFLDPSKTHLPIPDRASLLLPLSYLTELYPGHITCLEGLERYDKESSRINGTIFFLPLRKSSHFSGRKPFVQDTFNIDSFRSKILDDFRSKAADDLLFIKVDLIEARIRTSARDNDRLWSFTARRAEVVLEDGTTDSEISVEPWSSSESAGATMNWRVFSTSFQTPPEYSAGASSKILRVGLAAPLNDDHQYQSKFFSMLPLAIPATLPVHVNASFRLSSDRRQIRLDSYDNDDTRFNRWLLTEKLPPLYLLLLERIAQGRDNSRWWPGTRLTTWRLSDDEEDIGTVYEDSLSSTVIGSFYSQHLPHSTRRVFCSMYADSSYMFSEAVLYSARIPAAALGVLNLLQPPTVIKLSSRVRERVKGVKDARVVEPQFFKALLLQDEGAELVRQHLDAMDLSKLLVYLSSPDPTLLQGLPLLSLADGTWATFETSGAPYYSWPSVAALTQDNLFPPGRFLTPEAAPSEQLLTLARSSINIQLLDASAIKALVEERLGEMNASQMQEWIASFWMKYHAFPETDLLNNIESLPLIPTTEPTTFRSLIDIKNNRGLFSESLGQPVRACIQNLGIAVVTVDGLHAHLRNILQYGEYAPQDPIFLRFLHCIYPILAPAIQAFRTWPSPDQEIFAEWVRSNIVTRMDDFPVLSRLPVWTARRGAVTTLCCAKDVRLLPVAVPVTVGRFCGRFVAADGKLSHLGRARMTLVELDGMLSLPNVLQEGEDEHIYSSLLSSLLSSRQIEIMAPNANRQLVACDEMFERTEFYLAAFGPTSPKFLLQSFDRFTHDLYSHGLRREGNLDITIFAQCARALHDDDDPQKFARGRVLFDMYRETLPLHVPSDQASRWQELDGFRFVPRSRQTSRQHMSFREIELPAHIRALPLLVSPREVVRATFYDIAWTQRVSLAQDPGDRLLVAYPQFGCPSGEEVIAHLKALKDLPPGPTIAHDLEKTYIWLNQNIPAIESFSNDLKDESIFLNVDDPASGDWRWSAASQLALESHDLASIQGVRQFLKPFRDLLKAIGVLEAVYPEIEPEDEEVAGASHQAIMFRELRDKFAEMRSAGQLTDVVFIPKAEEEVMEEEDQPDLHVSELDPGQRHLLCGHRVFLAACSPMFHDMFTGTYQEAQRGSPIPLSETSEFAIKIVLDYLYTGRIYSQEQDVGLGDLVQTLKLSSYLQIKNLFDLTQREIITRRMVDPDTLESVRSCAERLGAQVLLRWCDEYRAQNVDYIRIISQENR